MTRTPIPRPIGEETLTLLICDACPRSIPVEEDEMPEGWLKVPALNYVGYFEACSDACSRAIRLKAVKRELESLSGAELAMIEAVLWRLHVGHCQQRS